MPTQPGRARRRVPEGRGGLATDDLHLDRGLPAALHDVRLIAGLVDLESLKVRAITSGALRALGRPAKAIIGAPAADLVDPQERGAAVQALEAMRSGAVDFYRGQRHIQGGPTSTWMIRAWARLADLGGRRYAFVIWLPDPGLEGSSSALADLLAHVIAVGVTNPLCTVRHASVEPDNPFRIDAADLVGTRLADRRRSRDIQSIADHSRMSHDGRSFAFPVTIAGRAGVAVNLVCLLTALVGSPGGLFMLSLPSTPTRVSDLERHLWRIAAEVEASGVLVNFRPMPDHALRRHPAAAALTPRQWEILHRIVSGERVPTIATELFLSQSTVRNHLSAIFERFGVHSQAELMAALTTTDGSSS